jgi:hypothetical protein
MDATMPDHSSHNRRLQINQVGSWSNLVRFTDRGDSAVLPEILHHACMLAIEPRLRILDRDGHVISTWTFKGGWKPVGARL